MAVFATSNVHFICEKRSFTAPSKVSRANKERMMCEMSKKCTKRAGVLRLPNRWRQRLLSSREIARGFSELGRKQTKVCEPASGGKLVLEEGIFRNRLYAAALRVRVGCDVDPYLLQRPWTTCFRTLSLRWTSRRSRSSAAWVSP